MELHDHSQHKLSEMFKDPRKLMSFLQQNKKYIILWTGFISLVYAIYAYSSSGDFSFTLTLGSLVQMFGFLLLAIKVQSSGSVSGLSKNTIICYVICLIFRNLSLTFFDGYLPFDKTGDFIYRVAEWAALFCASIVLYLMLFKFKASYNRDLDTFKWYWFATPTFILAVLFHPSLNSSFIGDFPWTYALYLESLAMFPQLDLFRQKFGEIEQFTSHFVASSGMSRILHFIFWIATYSELNEDASEIKNSSAIIPGISGYFVIAFQIIQLSLIAEYLFFYLKSWKRGIPLTLPTYYQN